MNYESLPKTGSPVSPRRCAGAKGSFFRRNLVRLWSGSRAKSPECADTPKPIRQANPDSFNSWAGKVHESAEEGYITICDRREAEGNRCSKREQSKYFDCQASRRKSREADLTQHIGTKKQNCGNSSLVEHNLARSCGAAARSGTRNSQPWLYRTERGERLNNYCGNSSVGRAQPCQGWGREFESRFPLKEGSTPYQ